MRTKRMLFPLLLVLSFLFSLAACGAQAPSGATTAAPESAAATATVPTRGCPVLRLASADYGYPSPYGYTRGPGYTRMSLIFDTLVWKDKEGKVIPWLAEKWDVSEDGTTWTFTLRSDVKWHDGEPLTAEDVVFTVTYFQQNLGPWSAADVSLIKQIEVADEHVVQMVLDEPMAPFLVNVAGSMPIIPKHIWQDVDDPVRFVDEKAVMGTGPYRLESYSKEEGSYLFVANPDYFLGEPYVKRIEYVPVADALVALRNGDIDEAGPWGMVTDEMLAPFQQQPFEIIEAPGEWHMALFFNLTKAPLDDINLRHAIAHALNLQGIVDRVLQGHGLAGGVGWLPPGTLYYNPDVARYAYDPEKAKSTLDEAGYKDSDSDGVRETADGKPLRFTLTYSTSDSPRLMELIGADLKAVGIEAVLNGVDRMTRDDIARKREYEILVLGHGGLGGDPDQLRRVFASFSKSKSFNRAHGYHNERFDELAKQQLHTLDEEKRRQMVNEMQAIIAEDVAIIPIYYPHRYSIFNADVLDTWFYTPGGYSSGIPMNQNKLVFVVP